MQHQVKVIRREGKKNSDVPTKTFSETSQSISNPNRRVRNAISQPERS